MRILTFTVIQITGILVLSCGKENDKATQQVVASPQGAVTPPIGQNPQPAPDQKDFPYSSRVYATSADLPACTESLKGALAYLMVQKIFQSCDANAWVTVDIGSKQTLGGKGLEIFDAENNKVGNLMGPYDVGGNTNQPALGVHVGLVFLDGMMLNLPSKSVDGRFFSQGYLPEIPSCWYTSTDCTGMCYLKFADSGEFALDVTGKARVIDRSSYLANVPLGSTVRPADQYGPVSCTTNASSYYGIYSCNATKSYTPTQFKYPFALPLSVR